ncbi:MAG TPA: DNA-binding domain-containing protein [Oligoflexia bacterium]|nr:DNA-binding domain-containing protein [Oligoflexia bacterium]HMP47203.1 DNA-binding domain-containing protein [Oligoflexia bacterium]
MNSNNGNYYTANSRKELSELQSVFFRLISRELAEGDAIISDPEITRLIAPNDKLNEEERLEIYARQYWWRLMQSLEEDFPVLRKILGSSKFELLLKDYIKQHPSESYTLRHFGRRLPSFIKSTEAESIVGDLQSLAFDVASFELYQNESFFAEEGKRISEKELTNIKPEELLVSLQPHVFPLLLDYPLHEHYHSFKKNQLRDNETNSFSHFEADNSELKVSFPYQKTRLVIYRYGTKVFAKDLEELEFLFLNYISEPKSLSDISQFLSTSFPETITEEEVFKLFSKCSELNWIGQFVRSD